MSDPDPRLAPTPFFRRLQQALDAVPAERRRPPPDARIGAVLVLLEEGPDGPRLVLTRRRRDLRSHPGQLSFPGGRADPGESIEEAALREAREEVDLDPASVEVLGRGLVLYVPPSRFWVAPVVARWRAPHGLDPNPWEVDAVLHVPLATLLEGVRWRCVAHAQREAAWAWQLDGGDLLWGATAMVVTALLEVAVDGWSGGLSPRDLPEERWVRPWEEAPAWQRRARLEGLPEVSQSSVVHVSARQMREVDRLLMEEAGLDLPRLAEHAGRAVTEVTRLLAGGDLTGVPVTVLAGPGGNGAGGLAAARLLDAAGAGVEVWTAGPARVAAQVTALEAAGVPVGALRAGMPCGEVVVDALLGYGARPGLSGPAAEALAWLRRHDAPVVALDLPSGLSADDGLVGDCVSADVTVTLAAPKRGLRPREVHPFVGDLYLADIGVPAAIWRKLGLDPPAVFHRGPLVRLTADRAPDAATPTQVAGDGDTGGGGVG